MLNARDPALIFNSNQQAAAFAWLREGANNGEPSNIVCHSLGCGNTLSRLRDSKAPHIDRLVTLDCAASSACGSVPDNVDFTLNIYQTGGILRGQANIRAGGSMWGITNVDVTGRGWTHNGIPERTGVGDAVLACINVGDCSGRGLSGPK